MSSSKESLLAIKSELSQSDVNRRCAAIRSIAQSESAHSGITTTVIRLVSDKNEEVSTWACESLVSRICPLPIEANDLIDLLRETKDGEVEYWAATMLGRLGPVASRATAVLANCLLESPCLAARERAAWALSEIGPPARSAINALKQIGPEDPPRLQRLAAAAIQSVVNRAA